MTYTLSRPKKTPAPESRKVEELRLTLVETGWSCPVRRPLIVGRGADCDLRIDDSRLARQHAEIYPLCSLWWVRDLGSHHGIFLEGEPVQAGPLGATSELRLGPDGPTLRLDRRTEGP